MKIKSGLCFETNKRASSILGTKETTFDKSRLGANYFLSLADEPLLTVEIVTFRGTFIRLLPVMEKCLAAGFLRNSL